LQFELDVLVVIAANVIVLARFEFFKTGKRCKMTILSLRGAEEALNLGAVKAAFLEAHALRDDLAV
jgi:hypothetical protein